MALTPDQFHKLIHSAVGTPKVDYEVKRRGKTTIRKPKSREHSANWAEATANLSSNKILLNVYLNMQQNSLSNKDFTRLKQLAKLGIELYWSTPITIGTDTFNVTVTANQRKNDSIQADLALNKMKDRNDYDRSYNLATLGIDASFIYNEHTYNPNANPAFADYSYMLTCAHEFGHSVLMYFGGAGLSWSHKGSTHIVPQDVKSSTPGYPASGTIDLMKYYDANKNFVSVFGRAQRTKAAEQDVKRLIWMSTITF
jgi:hypothetical protein